MTDVRKTISNLERDYAAHKDAFLKWKEEHSTLAGHASYNEYVERFQTWEKGVFDQLKELRALAVRQPVAPQPQLPTVDLDTQLNDFLGKIAAPEFIMAFVTMARKDPSFLHKAFEVVTQESKGTGFSNAILPQNYSISTPYIRKQPVSDNTTKMTSYLSKTPTNLEGFSPQTSQFSNSSYQHGARFTPQQGTRPYVQITPYGATANIPEGWALDAPIRKTPKHASPVREYRHPLNLPFKDFSQT